MKSVIYDGVIDAIGDGSLRLADDRFFVLLVTADYRPDEHHATLADVRGEVEGVVGYMPGGQELRNKTWALEGREGVWRAEPLLWGRSTISARAAVVYALETGRLVCCLDFGRTVTSSMNNFVLRWPARGILRCRRALRAGIFNAQE